MTYRRFTYFILVCAVILTTGLTARPAVAGHSVDPSTLNPPPPPEYNPVCHAVGSGVICDINWSAPEPAYGSGLICGTGAESFEVIGVDVKSVSGHRYYDQDLNLTERHFREEYVGRLTNPLTGAYLDFIQADTVMHNLTVPGDVATGNEHVSGSTRIWRPDGGVVLTDSGTGLLSSDGTILSESHHHPFDAYYVYGDTSALQPICDALMR